MCRNMDSTSMALLVGTAVAAALTPPNVLMIISDGKEENY